MKFLTLLNTLSNGKKWFLLDFFDNFENPILSLTVVSGILFCLGPFYLFFNVADAFRRSGMHDVPSPFLYCRADRSVVLDCGL